MLWVVDLLFALAVIVLGVVLTLSVADVVEIPDTVFRALSAAVIAVATRLQLTAARKKDRLARRQARAEKRRLRREGT